MQQLTLRGLDSRLADELINLSKEKNISLNKAALLLMRKGAGLTAEQHDVVGNSLDHLIGLWNEEDEKNFLETQALFESIDEELWK
ncbi:MAG: hypothetical protein R2880_00840 [Deinococcales bacterium]